MYSKKALRKGMSLTEKAAKKRLVHPNLHALVKGRELLWAAPGAGSSLEANLTLVSLYKS